MHGHHHQTDLARPQSAYRPRRQTGLRRLQRRHDTGGNGASSNQDHQRDPEPPWASHRLTSVVRPIAQIRLSDKVDCPMHLGRRSVQLCLNSSGTGIPSEYVSAGQRVGRRASWSVGRILCARSRGPTVIHLGLPLPAASCGLPADSGGQPSNVRAGLALPSPLDLAPGGVYRAAAVTCGAGGLLHHRFTLTASQDRSPRPAAVCFLWHFPAGRPGSALPTTLPSESGPSSAIPAYRNRRDRPSSSLAAYNKVYIAAGFITWRRETMITADQRRT